MASRTSSGNPSRPVSAPITKVEQTSDTLTGRGGLTLFSRYLRNVGIFEHLERLFGPLKKSAKGVGVSALFHQLFCFLVDGTSRHLVHFDALKQDEGYARGIETAPEEMASSHAVKRFFYAFGWGRIWVFRYLLLRLFLWHLKQVEPEVVRLGLDPMVMDNDAAPLREGVEPTSHGAAAVKIELSVLHRAVVHGSDVSVRLPKSVDAGRSVFPDRGGSLALHYLPYVSTATGSSTRSRMRRRAQRERWASGPFYKSVRSKPGPR